MQKIVRRPELVPIDSIARGMGLQTYHANIVQSLERISCDWDDRRPHMDLDIDVDGQISLKVSKTNVAKQSVKPSLTKKLLGIRR